MTPTPRGRRGRSGHWTFTGVVEPVRWGRATYTVLRVPAGLVDDALALGTRRVAGTIENEPVNLAVNRVAELGDPFVYAGASLLRRIRTEAGEPVSCVLAPEDPDVVHVPADIERAIDQAGGRAPWEALTPADRRRRVYAVESARTAPTRERRLVELLRTLAE
jgi:hypothetical protein